jgi:hypothetical protein
MLKKTINYGKYACYGWVKSFTVDFKHSVFEWIYNDEDNPKILYAAEQHFCSQGHSITKQTIHVRQLKHDEI